MREPENRILASLIRALDEGARHEFFERVDQVLAGQRRVYPVEAEAMVFIEMRAEARIEREHSGDASRRAGQGCAAPHRSL
jgi:hypothetical protein